MDKLMILGGKKLKGEVSVTGAKNSALPLLAATLLTDEPSTLTNVPTSLRDVQTMVRVLKSLGVSVETTDDTVHVDPKGYSGWEAPYKFVSTMRASVCVLGPLLGKQKKARVSLPGGCVIGPRPIDLHLKGLRALGADLRLDHGYVAAETQGLYGSHVYLGGPFGSSVLATANVLMAAALARGTTVIEDADLDILTLNVSWYKDNSVILNLTNISYNQGTLYQTNLSYNYTIHDNSIFCNITATDGIEFVNDISNTVSILNYSTSIAVENDTGRTINEQVNFYANYSNTMAGDIGRVVLQTANLGGPDNDDLLSVTFMDIDNDGKKDDFAVGMGGDPSVQLYGFYANGTQKWNASKSHTYEIEVNDFDNDSYFNEIAATNGQSLVGPLIYNETGDLVWQGDIGNNFARVVASGDINNDGVADVAAGDFYGNVSAFMGNGTKLWDNKTAGNSYPFELYVEDINLDGQNDVIAIDNAGYGTVFNGADGSILWNTTDLGNGLSATLIDLDNDGNKNEVIFASQYGGDEVYAYNSSGSQLWSINTGTLNFEIISDDFDSDGFEDDFVYSTAGTIIYAYSGNTTGETLLWSYSAERIFSLAVSDINDDGESEIIAGGDTNYVYIFNKTGSLLWEYNVSGAVGTDYGSSPGIDTSDNNNDGINDILAGSQYGFVYILQSVTCIAEFNDTSTVYNMSWDSSTTKWKINRTFSTAGDYSWNSTCSKGGYLSSVGSGVVSITPDTTSPTVSLISPANNTYENTTNTIIFTYNVTDANTVDNCSLILNGVLNLTNTSITKDISQTFTQTLADGSYNWSVNCTDASNNIGNSETFNLSVNADFSPVVGLVNPSNGTTTSNDSIIFTCNATDDNNLVNISLYHNINGSFQLNQTTNISGTINSTNWTINNIPEGTYLWNCLVYDNSSQSDFGNSNFTFTVGTPPEINFTSPTPANGTTQSETNVEINVSIIEANLLYQKASAGNRCFQLRELLARRHDFRLH